MIPHNVPHIAETTKKPTTETAKMSSRFQSYLPLSPFLLLRLKSPKPPKPHHPNFGNYFFLLLLFFLFPQTSSETRNFTLAIFFPKTGEQRVGPEAEAAVNWTVSRLNQQFKDRFQFKYRTLDTKCDKDVALTEFFDMMCEHRLTRSQINAVIGPACDEACQVVSTLAKTRLIPVISNGCGSPVLSDRRLYPTFLRTSSTFLETETALEAVFRAFRWTRITVVHGNGTVWLDTSDEFGDSLKHSGFQIHQLSIRNPDTLEEDLRNESEKTRVFLLLAYHQDILRFMKMAKKLQLTNGDYAFVTVNLANGVKAHANMTYFPVLDGLLDVTQDVSPHSDVFQQFIAQVLSPYTSASSCTFDYEMGIQAALLADAITLYAEALNATLTAQGDFSDSVSLVERLYGASIQGVSGPVTIDANGRREGRFMLHNIRKGCYFPIATYHNRLVFLNNSVMWPGGSYTVPSDSPPCGWNNERCDGSDRDRNLMIGGSIALATLTLAVMLISVCSYKFRKKRNDARRLQSTDWKISFKDLKKPRHGGCNGDSESYSPHADVYGGSTVSIESTDSMRSTVQKTEGLYYYRGQVVMVKSIHKPFGVAFTANLSKELNQIRQLENRNINPFIGACIDRGHISVISAYCRKGSLYDIIHKSDLDFDCQFIASLSADISRGLHYLHNSVVGYHGRLRSRNVLVDSTFTCKLGDIHMPHLREGEELDKFTDYYRTRDLWSAPEIVSGQIYRLESEEGGKLLWQRADMWSFGVILYEIITRRKPFPSLHDSNPEEAVKRLKNCGRPDEGSGDMLLEIRQRPHYSLNAERYLMKVIDLLGLCWQSYPELRVTSGDVSKRLREYGKEHGVLHINFYQNMLHMMTKNEEDLGRQVRERTLQLETEKNHTKRLLNEMLPAVVADQLLSGVTPPPEYFDCVTVFFSDIVQFTQLSASCTPLEVMTIVNSLYEYFDRAIDNFNVYKVETIGDAYMVASGLPQRNGNQHAGAIAAMALALLSGLDTLQVPSRPTHKMQVRVGIHSGPVVAGVVGTKMPRYCLFGDTVNTASRMESHSKPLKIQISKATQQLLERTGGFLMKKRDDPCFIKGKGEMETYWLVGRREGKEWQEPATPLPQIPTITKTSSSSSTTTPVPPSPPPSPAPFPTQRNKNGNPVTAAATASTTPITLTPTILLNSFPSPSPSITGISSTPCVNSVTPTPTPGKISPASSPASSTSPLPPGSVGHNHHCKTVVANHCSPDVSGGMSSKSKSTATVTATANATTSTSANSITSTGCTAVGDVPQGVHITVLNI